EKRTMAAGSGEVMRIAYSPNGKYLAAGTTEGDLTVWDTADGHVVAAFTTNFVMSLAFSPDSRLLASTAGCVQLWDLATQRELCRISDNRFVNAIAFSPNGKTVAFTTSVGSPQKELWFWNSE